MPRGPKGEKRPADVNARAVMIARIATGEETDPLPSFDPVSQGGSQDAEGLERFARPHAPANGGGDPVLR